MLDEATKVLKELKVADLYVINSLLKPTPIIIRGMELCCAMFGFKPKKDNIGKIDNDTLGFFHCAKQNFLSNPNKFKNDMIEYDKEHISKEVVKKVNVILKDPTFNHEAVKNASEALIGIVKWAEAMMLYYEILKIVNPMREQVKSMTEKLKVVQADLDLKRKKLAAVQAKLEELEAKMQKLMEEKESLEKKITDCSIKLDRANKIIEGLSGEKQRWTDTVKSLSD